MLKKLGKKYLLLSDDQRPARERPGVRGRTADLSIKEKTLPIAGPSGSNAGPGETSSRLELSDRFADAQLPFVVPKVSPWVSPKVSSVI